jgi:prevent-host-death family protein
MLKFILLSVNLKRSIKMHSSAKELRFHTKEILDSVQKGEEVVITFRGKPYAKIVPLEKSKKDKNINNELFGLWKNRKDIGDVNSYIRNLRRGRNYADG